MTAWLAPPAQARARCLFFESSSRSILLLEHDLFRKPVPTFRDHAIAKEDSMPLFFWFPIIVWAGVYGIAVEDDKQALEPELTCLGSGKDSGVSCVRRHT